MKNSQLPFQKIDQFTLEQIIQNGPYTMSVQAFQPSLNRPVFIKLLKPQVKNQELWVKRFKREAQICARLKHPNIVDVYTIGEYQDFRYMATEFVRGFSLKVLLEKEKILPENLSLAIIYQILQALQFAHQNQIIHRDLKPGNILVDIHGVVKVTDFGLAYLGEEYSVTQEGNILGTPAYMAPEQITGEPLTAATDLFALGATFYEMLTGIKPFAGENYSACIQKILNEEQPGPSQQNSTISETVDQIVLDLIAKNPKERPQSSYDAVARLESFFPEVSSTKIRNQIADLVKKHDDASEKTVKKAAESPSDKKRKILARRKLSIILPLILLLVMSVLIVIGQIRKNDRTKDFNRNVDLTTLDSNKVELKAGNELVLNEEQNSIKKNKMAFKKDSSQTVSMSKPKNNLDETDTTKMSILSTEGKDTDIPELISDRPEKFVSVIFDITPWAAVSLDGKLIDSLVTNREIGMPTGKHQLVLAHPQFMPKIIDIDISENNQPKISYSFFTEAAFLSIEVRPWAEVYIDRKFIDNTPLNRLIVLSPGEHLLELKHQNYQTHRQVLGLTAGDTLQIKWNMIK